MYGFLDRLRDTRYLSPADQAEFDIICRECAGLASLIGDSARNLESIASFLSTLALTRDDYRFLGCQRYGSPQSAMNLLIRSIRHVANPGLASNALNPARLMLRRLRYECNANLTLVTTNYDLHCELACIDSQSGDEALPKCRLAPALYRAAALYEPLQGGRMPPSLYAESGDQEALLLLKLHGSVNWYSDESQQQIEVDGRLVPLASEQSTAIIRETQEPAYWRLKEPRADDVFSSQRPVILPPTVLKPHSSPAVNQQWNLAVNAIAEADHIWFIGYSFPPTDSYMKYVLAAGLAQNARVRQIAIIDPSREVCFGRATRVFADPRFADIMQAFPFPWQKLNPERTLAGEQLHLLRDENAVRQEELAIRAQAVVDGDWASDGMYLEDEFIDRRRNAARMGIRGRGRGRGR